MPTSALQSLTAGEVVGYSIAGTIAILGAVAGLVKGVTKLGLRWPSSNGNRGANPYLAAAHDAKLDELIRISRGQLHVQRQTLDAVRDGQADHRVIMARLDSLDKEITRP